MRMRWMLIGTLLATAAAVGMAEAQTPASLAGEWLLDAERSQSLQDAIAAARGGAGGGVMMRGAAGGGGGGGGGGVVMRGPGGGMMTMLQAGQRLHIELTDAQVTLRTDDSAPITLPLTATATAVNRWDQQLQARASLDDGALTLETTLPNGVVVKEVFRTADGELGVELHMPLPMMGGGGGGESPTVTVRRVYTPAR